MKAWWQAARKNPLWACFVLLYLIILVGDTTRKWTPNISRLDFSLLLTAAARLLRGENPYQIQDWAEHTKPPVITMLFIPLSKVHWPWVCNVWTLVSVWLFVDCLRRLKVWRPNWQNLLAAFAVLSFFICELKRGQVNVFILWVLLVGLGKDSIGSGIGLALAVFLKPTNLLFVAFFAALKHWRTVISCALTACVLLGLYACIFGIQAFIAAHVDYWFFAQLSTAKHLLRADNYSLVTVIALLFPSLQQFSLISTLSSLFLAYAAGWAALRLKGNLLYYFGLCAWLSVILSPMAWMQNFVFLLPWVAFVLLKLWGKGWRSAPLAVFCFALYFFSSQILNYDFVGRDNYAWLIGKHYLLWSSLFLALAATMVERPFWSALKPVKKVHSR